MTDSTQTALCFNGQKQHTTSAIEVTILMPCLNEAETLGTCILKAQKFLRDEGMIGEILVADNGSTDGSIEIAQKLGARVVHVSERGYGYALSRGISAASGVYVIMGDADDSYDFSNLSAFIRELRIGYDLVMGNRFKGGIQKGAMPFLHQYLGNPMISWIGKLFFASPCNDFYCGLRAFNKASIERLNLCTGGMEFANEMVVKATLYKLKITEVPTILSPDGRSRPPHLRTWRDGWRTLRFLLLYSPRWLFLYPGLVFMCLGLLVSAWLLPGARGVFDIHTLLYAAAAIILGFQSVTFAVFTKLFAINQKLLPEDHRFLRFLNATNLEKGLILGVLLLLGGLLASGLAFWIWEQQNFGPLKASSMMRLTIPAVTAIVLGFQTILASFFLSVLRLKLQ
jgi:glycosyltransferase involved in cell wall biosynthesis